MHFFLVLTRFWVFQRGFSAYFCAILYKIGMVETMTGIVLHALRFKEDSIIVDIFTEQHGTVPFLVKVPRGRRPSLHTQLLRPLNILQLSFDFRPRLSLQRITDLRLAVPYTTLPYDSIKETLALFFSEFLYYTLRHEAANLPLLQFLCNSFQWLDLKDGSLANFHLVFLVQLSRHLGFWPQTEGLAEGLPYFDLNEGAFRGDPILGGYSLGQEESAMVPVLTRLTYGTMHLLRLNSEQRNYLLDILLTYYRLHVPEFPPLKSVEVLREVLRG